MKIQNPIMIILAVIQLAAAVYYAFWLKSPLLGMLQFTYAMSNIIIAMMGGI